MNRMSGKQTMANSSADEPLSSRRQQGQGNRGRAFHWTCTTLLAEMTKLVTEGAPLVTWGRLNQTDGQ